MTKSMLEIPEELNVMLPALRELVGVVVRQVERGRTGGSVDHADFQRLMLAQVDEIGRGAEAAALSALDLDVPRVLIKAPPANYGPLTFTASEETSGPGRYVPV